MNVHAHHQLHQLHQAIHEHQPHHHQWTLYLSNLEAHQFHHIPAHHTHHVHTRTTDGDFLSNMMSSEKSHQAQPHHQTFQPPAHHHHRIVTQTFATHQLSIESIQQA